MCARTDLWFRKFSHDRAGLLNPKPNFTTARKRLFCLQTEYALYVTFAACRDESAPLTLLMKAISGLVRFTPE